MGKATKGSFYSNGKKKQPTTKAERMALAENNKRVPPTPETMDYIERRLAYWTHPGIWNRAAAEQCYDNAGILWASGWFDRHGFQPDEIRDIFRKYAALYWRWYPAPKTSKAERVGKSEPSIHKENWERQFMIMDERLPLGSEERRAFHQLAVDGWHFDELDMRAIALADLGRLKIMAKHKTRLPVGDYIPGDSGREMDWLKAALRGAFMLLDAQIAKQARRGWTIPLWALNDDGEERAA